MSELNELYQELILDHSKSPRNFRVMENADRKAEGYNPLCGDRITLYFKMQGDRIQDVAFQGTGCAISKASTSMMTAEVKGKTRQEAEAIFQNFHQMLTTHETGKFDKVKLGKLAVFAGVSEFPVRVKCATLPWHTMRSGLEGKNQTVSTEAPSTEWTTG